MISKFTSFGELVEDMAVREGTAFLYMTDDEEQGSTDRSQVAELSYSDFVSMVESEIFATRASCMNYDIIRPELSVESIARILGDVIAGCDVIIADELINDDKLEETARKAIDDRHRRRMRRNSRGLLRQTAALEAEGELLFFSSSTSSKSKVVRLNSTALCASAYNEQLSLRGTAKDIILAHIKISHIYGLVRNILLGLCSGIPIALCNGKRPLELVDDMLIFKPTILPTVPIVVDSLLKYRGVNGKPFNDELQVVMIGGAVCKESAMEKLRSHGLDVFIGYGLTETSGAIAISRDPEEPDALYPCPGADILIEKDGEITVATPCMMEGYLGKYPMLEDERFYTGDIGYFDERGRLHLKGRNKDIIAMADGTKIYCAEYEDEIANASGARDIGLVTKGGRLLLIAAPGSNLRAIRKAITEFNRSLPALRQIQDVLVVADLLPRTATGKLKRFELQEKYGD